MAKRILAIVMALVLGVSMMTVFAFADVVSWGTPTLTADADKPTTLNVEWNEYEGATGYKVELWKTTGSSTPLKTSNVSKDKLKTSFTSVPAGTYYVEVTATLKDNPPVTIRSSEVTVYGAVTSKNINVVEQTNGSIKVSWDAATNSKGEELAEDYRVDYTFVDTDKKTLDGIPAKITANNSKEYSTTITDSRVKYANLKTVTVSYHDAKGVLKTIGTVNISNGTSSGGSSSQTNYVESDGLVSANGTVLTWSSYSSSIPASAYSIGYYYTSMNGQSTREATVAANSTYTYNVSSILSQFLTNYGYYGGTVTFSVYVSGSRIGGATYDLSYYAGYGSGYGYGSAILVTLTGYGTATVTWNAAAGAYSYAVVCNSQSQPVYGNTATVSFTYGSPAQITVYALNANGQISGIVGTAMISANGTVSYGNTTNLGGSVNGTTVNGNNCTLVVGSSSTSVSWNASYGAAYYTVVYLPQGGNARATSVYGTSTTIPVGSSESFDVTIIYNSSVIGSASYTAVSSNVTSSSTTNLTLTAKSSNYTTVSWSPVSGATFYQIDYYRTGANTNETTYTTATNVDVPFGKNVNWTVVVYAALSSGRMQTVGTATHKAGDDFPSTSTTTPTNPGSSSTSSQYVTGLKGTTGNKKITLSWNAASGASSYEVWYKRSSNSSWKKLGSTSKRSVNVTDLLNGTSYDFKIVANGKDSGVLTITPSTGASTTKTAPDPTGAGTTTTTSTVPVITSIEGGTASFTVKWNGITNGTEYQVWVANGNSNEYSRKATVTATSATITGLSAGTYKVRIKGTTNGTYKTLKEGGGSDYVTVTVK